MNNSSNFNSSTICEISNIYLVIQCAVLPPLIIVYILVLYIILKFKQRFKNSYFTLILSLGISDLAVIFYLYYAFVCCIFSDNFLGLSFDAVITFFMTSVGWFYGLYLNIFVSLNRFVAVAFFGRYNQIWTINRAKLISFISLMAAILSTIPYYIQAPEYYLIDCKSPGPPGAVPRADGLILFDMISGYGIVLFIAALHVVSVILSLLRYKKLEAVKQKYIREMKLLGQGTFVGVMLLLCEMFYYFPVFGELTFVITSVLSTSMNPIVYLIMDNRLRGNLMNIIKSKKGNNVQPVVQSTNLYKGNAVQQR